MVENDHCKVKNEVPSKRVLQRTPISSNLIKFKKNYKLDSSTAHKLHVVSNTYSSGKESLTTATSMRKISGKMMLNSEAPSNTESRCDSTSTDIETKIMRQPDSNDKGLIKRSLERIDNAVNRNTKMVFVTNEVPQFEAINGAGSNYRVCLESRDDSRQDNIQTSSVPFAGISLYMQSQAQSTKGPDSVVYESDCQDIDNFTLGPKQFSDLVAESKKKDSSYAMPKLSKAESSRNVFQVKGSCRNNVVKYLSADKILDQKTALNNEALKHQMYLINRKYYENPFVTITNQNNPFRRNRLSAIEGQQPNSEEKFDMVNRNNHCESLISSLSSTMNKFALSDTVNLEMSETRKNNKRKVNAGKVYYSHSPPNRANE